MSLYWHPIQGRAVIPLVASGFNLLANHTNFYFRTESLAFLVKPPRVIQGYLGQSVEINCATNDDDAAVSLLRKPHPFSSYKERKPKANKLSKKRQVFTILNLEIEDAGIYSCRATNRKNQTIQ